MNTSDYFYELPEQLIAQTPPDQRDQSRLLVMDRNTGALTHSVFSEVLRFLSPGDLLVLNDSKVIPARLFGRRESGTALIEMLLLRQREPGPWEVLLRPARKAPLGTNLYFEGGLTARVVSLLPDGVRLAELDCPGDLFSLLDRIGSMPLPPYIKQRLQDNNRYQTVYARHTGSAAAPTAGLHFTEALLSQAVQAGVDVAHVTLHVGLGTFRPVKEKDITNHRMHTEWCEVPPETAEAVNRTKAAGGRVIAVGTTSCRTLESMQQNGIVHAGSCETGIFIYPSYHFQVIDGLITNFHLPESTLLMLVSAFAGREAVLAAYQEAVAQRYRFFSFGDAMLII